MHVNDKNASGRPVLIKNGLVFHTEGSFEPGVLFLRDGVFAPPAEAPADAEIVDAGGLYLIPGLTDLHFHGCMGHDFCEGSEEAIRILAEYEESVGVTAICPATMTFPEEKLTGVMRAAAGYRSEGGAALAGINMEGPFLSREKCGAQNPAYLAPPDAAMFRRLQEAAGGLIRLVDLAPETEGAFPFIEALRDETVLSLAHTAADYDLASRAFAAGIRHVTHLYNAMNPMSSRAPGPIAAAADADGVEVEMICDGIHIHSAMVRTAFRMFGDDRIIFISDSMEATGLPDGDYELGGQPVHKQGSLCTLADGTIAGSATNLMDCMRKAVRDMDIPLASAVKCAAVNPARSLGITDRRGSLETGRDACLVALDKDLEISMIYNRGRRIR